MRRIIKIFASLMLALLAVVFLVLVGVHGYLKTDHAQNLIRTRVNDAIPGHIDWTNADISILGTRVDLRGLTISGPDDEVIIKSDRVFLDIALSGLLRGNIVVVAALDSPNISLIEDQAGHLNIVRAFSDPSIEEERVPETDETETDFPFNIILKSVSLSDGFVTYRDQDEGHIAFDDINVKIEDTDLAQRSGSGYVSIGNGMVDMGGIRIPLSRFHFESLIHNGRIEPILIDIRFEGENGGPHLMLSGGAIDVFGDPRLDIELNAAAELSDISKMLSLETPLSGKATLSLFASGSPGNPAIRLQAHYGGGTLAGVDFEEAAINSTMEDLSVRLARFYARMDGAAVDVTGTVDLKNAFTDGLFAAPTDLDAISYDLVLESENIDFDELVWTESYLSGIADARVELKGTGIFPETLETRISGKVSGRQIAAGDFLAPVDPDILLEGEIKEGRVFADPIELVIQDTRLRVAGNYAIFDNALDIAVDLDTPNMAQFLDPLGVAVTSQKSTLSGTVAGPVMQPEINARVQSDNLTYDDIQFGDVRLNAELEKSGRVLIKRLFADNRGSAIEITGHLDLFDGGFGGFRSDMPAELAAVLNEVEIPDFVPHIDLAGKFSGQLFLADKITSPSARLSLAASGLGFGETRIGDLEAEITLSEGTLAITEMALENRQSQLRLTGTADLFVPGSLSLLPAPKLDLVFPESDLYIDDFIEMAEGRITIHGHAGGELNDLRAQLLITGSDLEIAGNVIGALTATAGFENGRLTVAPLEIVNEKSAILVTGGIDLFHPTTFDMYQDPAIEAEITSDAIHIENFISDMAGQLSVTAVINGSVNDLRGNIEINGEHIDLGVQKIESLHLASVLRDNTLFIDPARISLAEGEAIRIEGHISLDREYTLEIDSDAIRLDRIGVLEDVGLSGTMTIAASGAGSFKDPNIKGNISFNDLTVNRNEVEPITVDFNVDDRVASATATSNFILASRFNLDSGAFAINGEFDDTLLDPFLHPAGLTGITGNITADFKAGGNIDNLAQAAADFNIEQLVLVLTPNGAEPIELVRVARLSATYEDGTFAIPENEIVLVETSRIAVAGKGHLDGDFDFNAKGVIPLMVAGVFIPELDEPQGEINFSARVNQTDGRPDFDIDVRLRDLGFIVPELMQNLHQVNGRIHIVRGAISIENIRGMLDTGGFTASGTIELDEGLNPGQADISLSSRALPINIPGIMDASINSQLRFSGTPESAALSGQLVLLDGLYYRDVEINLIGEVTRRRRAAPTAAEPTDIDLPYLKNLALDIDISYRQPLMVDNNIALMTLRPEIRINGTLAQPGVTGRAQVGQGTVSYQNIEFNIDRGIIDFIDPYRIQPEIDIRAISRVRHWTITLEITGTPDDLEFLLTSNPPEEHADILSLIILGQTTREMAEGTGPAGPSPEEMLVNMLAGRFEEDIRTGTGLDIVEFEYSRPGVTEDDETVRVTVGKELSRRLTVTYGVERKGGETVQQHTAIYKLLEFMLLSAFQDTGGTFGGELQIRLEFR